MLHEVNHSTQTEILELLDEQVRCPNKTNEDDVDFASLVRDLDKAIIQMQINFLEGRI